MFRTILVPLNGSRFAEAALPLAAQLARGARARLHLVLAHQPVAAFVGMGDAVVPPSGFDQDLRAQEKSYLADIAARLLRAGTGPVEFEEIEGPAGPAICEEASRLDADLLVMASHGRSALGRLWLGSVADYVVRHLAVPVILVHPDRAEDGPRVVRSILVALDLSRESEAILEPVKALAQLTQAHVTLIHAVEAELGRVRLGVPSPRFQDPAQNKVARAEAQRQLDQVADRLRERGLSVSTRATIGINAAATILEALNESRFDLVAMTTHGAGGIRRLRMGSVADKVIRGAAKPVLVQRPLPAL